MTSDQNGLVTRDPRPATAPTDLPSLTLQLCKIPSETGHERPLADYVQERCSESGIATIHRVGNSVICWDAEQPGAELPAVALVGHLDTVRCAERQDYQIADGKVFGCGASDMKAGVAIMLALLERREELAGARPVWIFYDKEEGPNEENGLQPVLDSGLLPPLDFAFVLEPTDGALQLGCMGTLHVAATVRGARAHSARPWQGENALYRAIPLLERLAARQRREVRYGELVFYEVITATQAATVNSKNVVPDALELNINHRFAPGTTPEEALAELRELVGDDADIEIVDSSPAGAVYLDHPLIEEWRAREGLTLAPKQAWTDVARLTAAGIPAVNFGPGETAQAHQTNEWCSISSLDSTYASLLNFFRPV